MANTGGINYKATSFIKYPEVTKIHGEPKLGPFITMPSEIKANMMSVPTELGGGAHGHLGMAVFPEEYQDVLDTPYKHLETSPELDISGTQYEIAKKRHEYGKNICWFREIQGVERALIQQIVSAIEPKFLQVLCNPITSKINKTTPQIFKYLFIILATLAPRRTG